VAAIGDKEEKVIRIYICCKNEEKEHYEEKVKKYFVNAYVAKTLEEATDVFIVNGEYPEVERKARKLGKNVHKVNGELMIQNCEEKINKFL